MPLPKDNQQLQELQDSLRELRRNLAFQALVGRLNDLVSQDQRLLEREDSLQALHRCQGRIEAYKRVTRIIEELKFEVDNTISKEAK